MELWPPTPNSPPIYKFNLGLGLLDVSPKTETVASRIDVDSKAKLEEAAEECDLTPSAYLRTVLEEHIDENPNDLRALESHTNDDPYWTEQSQQDKPTSGFVEGMLEDME